MIATASGDRQRPVLDQRPQARAGDVLHRQVRRVGVRVEADRADDVRVRQAVDRDALALEVAEVLRVGRDLDGDELVASRRGGAPARPRRTSRRRSGRAARIRRRVDWLRHPFQPPGLRIPSSVRSRSSVMRFRQADLLRDPVAGQQIIYAREQRRRREEHPRRRAADRTSRTATPAAPPRSPCSTSTSAAPAALLSSRPTQPITKKLAHGTSSTSAEPRDDPPGARSAASCRVGRRPSATRRCPSRRRPAPPTPLTTFPATVSGSPCGRLRSVRSDCTGRPVTGGVINCAAFPNIVAAVVHDLPCTLPAVTN